MGLVDDSMYERYHVGDQVKIIRGPLEGTQGTITYIDKETGACRVETVFFGKPTPVDVDFSEIEKSNSFKNSSSLPMQRTAFLIANLCSNLLACYFNFI